MSDHGSGGTHEPLGLSPEELRLLRQGDQAARARLRPRAQPEVQALAAVVLRDRPTIGWVADEVVDGWLDDLRSPSHEAWNHDPGRALRQLRQMAESCALWTGLVAGEASAREALWERWQPRLKPVVVGHLRRLLPDPSLAEQEAEDVTAELLVDVIYKHAGRVREWRALWKYVRLASWTACKRRAGQVVAGHTSDEWQEDAGPGSDPPQQSLEPWVSAALAECWAKLPTDRDRQVLRGWAAGDRLADLAVLTGHTDRRYPAANVREYIIVRIGWLKRCMERTLGRMQEEHPEI